MKIFKAKDFSLQEKLQHGPVFMVLNRGFYCPYCRSHMEELLYDVHRFEEKGIQVCIFTPESVEKIRSFLFKTPMPNEFYSDPKHAVSRSFGQRFSWRKLGHLPTQILYDVDGKILKIHHSVDMKDHIPNEEVLGAL